jgi:hypothetical protein
VSGLVSHKLESERDTREGENGREFELLVLIKSLRNNSVLICEPSSISTSNSCT